MKKVKMILSWCIPVLLITIALLPPAMAQAASIKIWPDQVKPMEPNSAYYQSATMVRNGTFYAPLTLPKAARITKATYYHYGTDPTARTTLVIRRIKMGNSLETLGSASSTDSTSSIIPLEVELYDELIVRAGYRYFIQVQSFNDYSNFMGVKIDYQE